MIVGEGERRQGRAAALWSFQSAGGGGRDMRRSPWTQPERGKNLFCIISSGGLFIGQH